MKRKCIFLICFILISSSLWSSLTKGFQIEVQQTALNALKELPNEGILTEKPNGYLYIDITNEYIHTAEKAIKISGEFTSQHVTSKGIGAHITVLTETERAKHKIAKIDEVGQKYTFQVREFQSFLALGTRVWIVAVEAPEIEELRAKYHLPKKMGDHDFHITIGEDLSQRVFWKRKRVPKLRPWGKRAREEVIIHKTNSLHKSVNNG